MEGIILGEEIQSNYKEWEGEGGEEVVKVVEGEEDEDMEVSEDEGRMKRSVNEALLLRHNTLTPHTSSLRSLPRDWQIWDDENDGWCLVDCGDVVVHFFEEAMGTREKAGLEKRWSKQGWED